MGVADRELNSDEENELDHTNQGELDVDLVEPTLAERLTALKVGKASSLAIGSSGQVDDGEVEMEYEDDVVDSDQDTRKKLAQIPSATLTTTLIQALHSSDGPLLESCLSHTNTTLIRSTVKRLNSGNLVLNLLEVLVEKLARGKKGKEGGAGVKRARGLIEWVRQVLVIHVGFLVTVSRFPVFDSLGLTTSRAGAFSRQSTGKTPFFSHLPTGITTNVTLAKRSTRTRHVTNRITTRKDRFGTFYHYLSSTI